MADTAHAILERFRLGYGKDIDLTLRAPYRDLLTALGNPQNHLPAVIHVAGTNGKGSTCAFMRAILESAGLAVHVYSSPHLVAIYERIRLAGTWIGEDFLRDLLARCESLTQPGTISYFEAWTAAALAAFAQTPADVTILEVGLGGRLDATNVVDHPMASVITRLSFDHCEYLGDTMAAIAGEKAGIMRSGVPCFTLAQPSEEAAQALRHAAAQKNAPLFTEDQDWHITPHANGFRFDGFGHQIDLPRPALLGRHQYRNAGLAIATLLGTRQPVPAPAIAAGLQQVSWPARLQHLGPGPLTALLPAGWDLWLDGGHNDSAGEVLAQAIADWQAADPTPRPLSVILGMINTKDPAAFLGPFAHAIDRIQTVTIPDESLSQRAEDLAHPARALGIAHVDSAPDVTTAIQSIIAATTSATGSAPSSPAVGGRILITGSLYLAGHVLRLNGA